MIDTIHATVDSFAGTGNPFLFGDLHPGEVVLVIGCGAGLDTLIAARQVGAGGQVVGVGESPVLCWMKSGEPSSTGPALPMW